MLTLEAVPAAKPVAKLDYVNALRGWAILSVILVHNGIFGSTDASWFPGLFKTFINQGARGVQLFFVVSAFTLFLSMSKRKQEKSPVRNFFIRRFFRIAPMYYVSIALYYYWFTLVQPKTITIPSLLANITFMHGINPYWMIDSLVPGGWSITVEVWFYCLAPLLFLKLKTVDLAVRFIAYSMLVSCLLYIVLTYLRPMDNPEVLLAYLFFYFPNQLGVFGFGILLYLLLANDGKLKTLQPSTFLLVAGTALFILYTGFGNNLLHRTGSVSEGQHYWFAAAFMLLAFGLSKHSPRLLVNPVINYIGELSFSLYLVHFVVLFVLNKMGFADFIHPTRIIMALLDFALRYIFVVACGVAISAVTYRLIEIPFQNLGKRLIAKLEA